MNLPALEGDIILNDKGSPAFTKLEQSSQKAGRSLDQIQAKADRVATSLTKLDRAGGSGGIGKLGNAFGDLPTGGLGDLTDEADTATNAATRLRENLDALGPAPVANLLRHVRYLGEDISDLSDRTVIFQKELEATGAGGGKLAEALLQAGDAPFLRNLPIGNQAEDLGKLLTLLPRVSSGTLALAGGIGVLGAAAYGAYAGLNAMVDRIDQLQTQSAQKEKISFFGNPDEAINEVQNALQDRLGKDGVLSFLLKVDSTGALAEINNFNSVAAAVQAHADKFGQDWQGALDIAIEAIQAGDGEALERLGLIKDADAAYRRYAEAVGKTVQQLTPYQRQQALINAITAQNLTLVEAGPSAIDKMRAAQERLSSKMGDTKSAIADFAVSLFAPEVENAATWWAGRLDGVTEAIDRFGESLNARTELNKVAGSLTDGQLNNWNELNAAIEETNRSLVILRDQSLSATLSGNDQEAERIDQEIDKLDRKLEDLRTKRDKILADAKAGKTPEIGPVERPAAPAGSQVFLPSFGAIGNAITGNADEKAGRTATDLSKEQLNEVIDLEGQLEQKIAANRAKANEVGESIVSAAIDGDANRAARMKDLLAEIEAQIAKDEQTLQELLNDPALSLDPAFVAKAIGPQIQTDANKVAESVDPQMINSLAGTYGSISDAIVGSTNAKTEEVKQGTDAVQGGLDELTQAILAWRYTVPQANLEGQLFLPIISSASEVNKSLTETSKNLDLVVMKAQETGGIDVSGVAGAVTTQIAGQVGDLVSSNPAGSVDPALVDALAGTYGDLTSAIVDGTTAKADEVKQGVEGVGEQIDALMQEILAWQTGIPNVAAGNTNQVFLPVIESAKEANQAIDETTTKIDDVEAKASDFVKLSAKVDTGTGANAQDDKVTAAEDAVAAYNGLTRAQLEAAAASATYMNTAAEEAEARNTTAEAILRENAVAGAAVELKAAAAQSTMRLAEGAAITTDQLIALAQANQNSTTQMEGTEQVAGMLFDSFTGLPVAFDTAGLSAERLAQDLVSLMNQMDALQTSAVGASFSIAQRLVPAMGISGSLQQAQQWAGQAQQVRQAIDRENAEMLAAGRDPFGVEVTQFAMEALQQNWSAQATDIIGNMQEIQNGAGGMASATEQAAERMNSALDGIISGVLQDSTKGLIPLDDLLPREDAVDEPARRMADIAVKGFQSPWFEGMKNLFPDDVMSQGEDAIKRFAAEMVRGHQEGLTTALYDVDAAAAKVIEKIQAKQNQDELIAQVREKVKGLAGASDLDIMDALGIDTGPERMRQAATAMTVPFEEILAQIGQLSEGDSPLAKLLTPDEATTEGVQQSGRDAIALAGEAMVSQAGEGAYGSRAISAIVTQLTEKEKDLKGSGKKLGEWLGTGLLDQFKEEVPKALLDILVTELVPLMGAAAKADKEREAGTGTQ